ncbi:hypothetical protein [Qipengyuania intermedia]|nr:hypothetical protein [Qipengyuania intermedia]
MASEDWASVGDATVPTHSSANAPPITPSFCFPVTFTNYLDYLA